MLFWPHFISIYAHNYGLQSEVVIHGDLEDKP